jgi:hypothetical protein
MGFSGYLRSEWQRKVGGYRLCGKVGTREWVFAVFSGAGDGGTATNSWDEGEGFCLCCAANDTPEVQ